MNDNTYKILEAFVALLNPLVEVVIHNINTNKIEYINGNLSNRKVGEDSMLAEITDITDLSYAKINFDGVLVKSISIKLNANQLLCINCNISIFQQMLEITKILTKTEQPQPESLFKNDWQEKIHIALHAYIKNKSWNFNSLNNTQKKEIAQYLYTQGAFVEKNATDYIAKVLKLGRATLFNYLKQWRKNEN